MSEHIRPPFHLAFPVSDLDEARRFYTEVLGCSVGREGERWIDFNFHGHQITAHLAPEEARAAAASPVDGHAVPVRHFGLVLDWQQWHEITERLRALGIAPLIEPHTRFQGEVGEQATIFLTDPSGNALELKAFRDPAQLFARE